MKFKFRHVSSSSCIWKKDGNFFRWKYIKVLTCLMVNSFVIHYVWQLWLIAYYDYNYDYIIQSSARSVSHDHMQKATCVVRL